VGSPVNTEKKRIAQNTLYLYLRMLINLMVGLYTSRIILDVLGVSDYGLYNVVGGVVVLFSFLTGALGGATSRYITYHVGKKNVEELIKVFGNLKTLHILLALVIFVLAETIGLWFLNTQLNIPAGREEASFWVYQYAIFSAIIGILSLPYYSNLIAHERLGIYAVFTTIETVLKLVIVIVLPYIQYDSLIAYSFLFLLITTITRLLFLTYSRIKFVEAKTKPLFDKSLLHEISLFAIWTLVGHFAVMGTTQGLNILLNLFYGTVVNAARGVAVQVQGVIMQFCYNFQMALNPQLTKSYADGELINMRRLLIISSKFSFYLLLLLTLPIVLETKIVLDLWLKSVPQHTIWFVRLILFQSLMLALSNPLSISIQATGKIKKIKIIEGLCQILTLPISFLVLMFSNYPPESVFIISCLVEIFTQIIRVKLILPIISIKVSEYITEVIIPIIKVLFMASLLPFLYSICKASSILSFCISMLFSMISVCLCSYYLGLNHNERQYINRLIASKLSLSSVTRKFKS